MKAHIQPLASTCFLLIILVFAGCSTRTFNITCEPDDALILHGSYYGDIPFQASPLGFAPLSKDITFIGKGNKCYYTAMRRGYKPDTIVVTRDSALAINFNLKTVPKVDTSTFNPEKLIGGKFYMLPLHVDVYIHKGVGNLDSYEHDLIKSDTVTKNVNDDLKGTTSGKIHYVELISLNEPRKWDEQYQRLYEYLFSLNGNLLNYYPAHPSVKDISIDAGNLIEDEAHDSCYYLVYTYCKTIKPTAGRIVGNVTASAVGSAIEGIQGNGYMSSYYYNAEAFSIDNSTLIVAFVICPKTGKVLARKDKVVGFDIVNEKSQKKISEVIMGMMAEYDE